MTTHKVDFILSRTLSAFVLGMSVVLSACGGAIEAPAAPAPAVASSDLSTMAFLFQPSRVGAGAIDGAVQSALVGAGYNLVTDAKAPHDAVMKVTASVTPQRSFMQTYVNGVLQVSQSVSVAVDISSNGRVIDHPYIQFTASNNVITEAEVQPLLTAINATGKLAEFAQDRRARAGAEVARAKQAKGDADESARKHVEAEANAAWEAAKSNECAAAGSPTSCDALRAWSTTNQSGPHADEAGQILRDAEPKTRLLRETAAWQGANVDACTSPKTSGDCAAVETYLMTYGNDVHSQAARDLLHSKKLIALKAADEQRKKVEEQREAQREKAEEQRTKVEAQREAQQQRVAELNACRENCTSKDGFCGVHRDLQERQACSVKCIERQCK